MFKMILFLKVNSHVQQKKIRFQSLKFLHFKVHRFWPYPQTQACQEQTLYQGFLKAYVLKRFCNIDPCRKHTKLERFF